MVSFYGVCVCVCVCVCVRCEVSCYPLHHLEWASDGCTRAYHALLAVEKFSVND